MQRSGEPCLLARDLGREAPRMFRLDRIGAPRVLDVPFEARPLSVFTPLVEGIGAERLAR